MNNTRLRNVLIRHEGIRYEVYLDTEGLKTAGIGHLLIGVDRDRAVGSQVDQRTVTAWFDADVSRSVLLAKQIVPSFDSLNEVRQELIVNMTFNMGNRLKEFKKFLAAVAAEDFDRAANELQDSKWFQQVKTRGPEVVESFRHGHYTFDA